jgi:predicted SprT family Zn-dependent metalloprotease
MLANRSKLIFNKFNLERTSDDSLAKAVAHLLAHTYKKFCDTEPHKFDHLEFIKSQFFLI